MSKLVRCTTSLGRFSPFLNEQVEVCRAEPCQIDEVETRQHCAGSYCPCSLNVWIVNGTIFLSWGAIDGRSVKWCCNKHKVDEWGLPHTRTSSSGTSKSAD